MWPTYGRAADKTTCSDFAPTQPVCGQSFTHVTWVLANDREVTHAVVHNTHTLTHP